jgi:hypothetical protein
VLNDVTAGLPSFMLAVIAQFAAFLRIARWLLSRFN